MFFRLAGPGLQGEDGLKPDQHLDVIGDDAWIVTGGSSSPARWRALPCALRWRTNSGAIRSDGRAGVVGAQAWWDVVVAQAAPSFVLTPAPLPCLALPRARGCPTNRHRAHTEGPVATLRDGALGAGWMGGGQPTTT
ncbi:hypothetical protein BJF82_10515 [Kytococcus sp. CUA-901]|nr:hypothetical protein BJF82_10515 [Kytococcus sp. CUA-901]